MTIINVAGLDSACQDWVAQDVYRVLGYRVLLRSTSAAFAAQVRRLLRSFPVRPANGLAADVTFSFVLSGPDQPGQRAAHTFYHGDTFRKKAHSHWRLFRLLEWRLRLFLAQVETGYHLFHAGAVARNGMGILLPAQSGHGKSTLTMALLLAGFDYYTDELAVVDTATAALHPMPKPFSLRDVSIFSELAGREHHWLGPERSTAPVGPQPDRQREELWFIHPEDVRPGAIGPPVPLGAIIFPRYDAGRRPHLEPVAPGLAMRTLVGRSFNFTRDSLTLLSRLAGEVPCYTLASNDLNTTTELIAALSL